MNNSAIVLRRMIGEWVTEIDAAVLRRSRKLIVAALQDGAFLTRTEIAALLKRVKIDTSDIRMNFLMMDAELEGLVCSGPRRGKQFTYALSASRVTGAVDFSGDEALGELARRYFLSRGPAAVNDLAWWGGMTLGQAKIGLEVTFFEQVSKTAMGAIRKEARRFGRFLGEGVEVRVGRECIEPLHPLYQNRAIEGWREG
jgi:hypothetical protein